MSSIFTIGGTLGRSQTNVARFSDGTFCALANDGDTFYYSLSTNNGVSWGTKTSFGGTTFGSTIGLAQDPSVPNTLYVYWNGRLETDLAWIKLVYNTGTQTIAVTTYGDYGGSEIFPNPGALSAACFDADHGLLHSYNAGEDIFAVSTSAPGTAAYSIGNPFANGLAGIVYASGSLYLLQNGVVKKFTAGSSSYTFVSSTTVKASANTSNGVFGFVDGATGQPAFVAADSTTNTLDLYSYNGTSWSTSTLLSSAGIAGVTVCTDVSDLFVVYCSTTSQANGEVYLKRRVGGTWTSPTLVAGGDAGGYVTPSVPGTLASGAQTIPIVYMVGTGGTKTLTFAGSPTYTYIAASATASASGSLVVGNLWRIAGSITPSATASLHLSLYLPSTEMGLIPYKLKLHASGHTTPERILRLRVAGIDLPAPSLVVVPSLALGIYPAGTQIRAFWDSLSSAEAALVSGATASQAWVGVEIPNGWVPQFLARVDTTLTSLGGGRSAAVLTLAPSSTLRLHAALMPAQFY